MSKEVSKSSQHLVNLMLDREVKKEKIRFSDIDLKEFQNEVRTKKMLADLELRTAETKNLLKE